MKSITSNPSPSSFPIFSTYQIATAATMASNKPSNIKMTAITIFVVVGICVIAGCISMIYCYYVHKKSMVIQSKQNLDEITPPILTLKEKNSNYTIFPDTEKPNEV